MKPECFIAHCDNNFHPNKPITNPAAWLSPADLNSEFPSIPGVRCMGGGTSQDLTIINRIQSHILKMLLIISTLYFLCTMFEFTYYTFSDIHVSQSLNFFVLVTCHHCKSWHKCAALRILQLFLPGPGEGDDLSTTSISMSISTQYRTITMIVKMTTQNWMTRLISDHPGKQWASANQKVLSRQHLEHESGQLNHLPCRHNPYILSIGGSIFSLRWRMNANLCG